MKKIFLMAAGALMALCSCTKTTAATTEAENEAVDDSVATVYFIKDITPDNMMKIYNALGRKADGQNVAVKLSTGEAGNPNHLAPDLIKPLVQSIQGTIVECNTAYPGKRCNTAEHLQTAAEHGFTAIAPVDIMDAEGQVSLPVRNGKWLKEDIVGKDFMDYDFLVVLSHFKGHPMAGFGGALKNIVIGIASSEGKANIHSAGKTTDVNKVWNEVPSDSVFQESMADAASAIIDHVGDKVLYINVANNLSVDCDCVAHPQPVEMKDLGIFASLDPVALDRACVDAVMNADDHGKVHLIERINDRKAMHLLETAEQKGLGTQKYKLVELK